MSLRTFWFQTRGSRQRVYCIKSTSLRPLVMGALGKEQVSLGELGGGAEARVSGLKGWYRAWGPHSMTL